MHKSLETVCQQNTTNVSMQHFLLLCERNAVHASLKWGQNTLTLTMHLCTWFQPCPKSVMFSFCVIIIKQPLFKMCNVIDRQVWRYFDKKKKKINPYREDGCAVTNKYLFINDYEVIYLNHIRGSKINDQLRLHWGLGARMRARWHEIS